MKDLNTLVLIYWSAYKNAIKGGKVGWVLRFREEIAKEQLAKGEPINVPDMGRIKLIGGGVTDYPELYSDDGLTLKIR